MSFEHLDEDDRREERRRAREEWREERQSLTAVDHEAPVAVEFEQPVGPPADPAAYMPKPLAWSLRTLVEHYGRTVVRECLRCVAPKSDGGGS